MKRSTRNDLIYLVVGLCVAALVVVDLFYADLSGRQMWWPSNFWAHLLGYMVILEYFVARETRKAGAGLGQTIICILATAVLHAGTAFALHGLYDGPFTLVLFAAAMLEFFIILQLAVWAVRHWLRRA